MFPPPPSLSPPASCPPPPVSQQVFEKPKCPHPPWDNEGRSVAERLPAEWLPCIYRHHPGLQPNHSPLLTLILNLKQSSFIRLVGSLSSRRRWLPEYNHWVQTSLQCVNFTGFWLGLLPLIGGHPRTENPIDSLSQYCTGSLPARWTR